DELDAVTCALVGYLYLKGDYVALGDEEEGTIIMPKLCCPSTWNLVKVRRRRKNGEGIQTV
ncbi:MAG: hypothetical protein QXG45_02370, partial [Nitrososphaerota archaeon]